MSTASGERRLRLAASRKALYTLPLHELFELPGRPHVVYMLTSYADTGNAAEAAQQARDEIPFLFKAFETGQIGPKRMAKMHGGKPRVSTIHEYLDWTITAQAAQEDDELDFGGFRVLLLLPRFVPHWPIPDHPSTVEGVCASAPLGPTLAPLPFLQTHGRALTAATIRSGPGYLEIPFVATHESKRGRGYCRCLLEAIEDIARALALPKLLLCSTNDPLVKSTWHHLGFDFTTEQQMEEWDTPHSDLVYLQNTTQMHKQVPPPGVYRAVRIKQGLFQQRVYARLDEQAKRPKLHVPPPKKAPPKKAPSQAVAAAAHAASQQHLHAGGGVMARHGLLSTATKPGVSSAAQTEDGESHMLGSEDATVPTQEGSSQPAPCKGGRAPGARPLGRSGAPLPMPPPPTASPLPGPVLDPMALQLTSHVAGSHAAIPGLHGSAGRVAPEPRVPSSSPLLLGPLDLAAPAHDGQLGQGGVLAALDGGIVPGPGLGGSTHGRSRLGQPPGTPAGSEGRSRTPAGDGGAAWGSAGGAQGTGAAVGTPPPRGASPALDGRQRFLQQTLQQPLQQQQQQQQQGVQGLQVTSLPLSGGPLHRPGFAASPSPAPWQDRPALDLGGSPLQPPGQLGFRPPPLNLAAVHTPGRAGTPPARALSASPALLLPPPLGQQGLGAGGGGGTTQAYGFGVGMGTPGGMVPQHAMGQTGGVGDGAAGMYPLQGSAFGLGLGAGLPLPMGPAHGVVVPDGMQPTKSLDLGLDLTRQPGPVGPPGIPLNGLRL